MIFAHLRRAYRDFDLRFHRDENLGSGTKTGFTCWKPSVNSFSWINCSPCEFLSVLGLTYWNTAFSYLQLWYPVYCNELDHFWELSAHLIGKLRLPCLELLLPVSFGAPLLEKSACELDTVDESLWLHVKNRVSWDMVIRNACIVPETHPIVWAPIAASYSVPGYTSNRMASFQIDATFSDLVRAIRKNLENFWKFQISVKKL